MVYSELFCDENFVTPEFFFKPKRDDKSILPSTDSYYKFWNYEAWGCFLMEHFTELMKKGGGYLVSFHKN